MRDTSSEPGSYERTLHQLLVYVLDNERIDHSAGNVTICAPSWVLERVSQEARRPIEAHRGVQSVTTDSLIVTAVPALEEEAGLGFLAAVDVIGGRCFEVTACHTDVVPDRWPDLTLALAHGLGREVAVAIEQLGTLDGR